MCRFSEQIITKGKLLSGLSLIFNWMGKLSLRNFLNYLVFEKYSIIFV